MSMTYTEHLEGLVKELGRKLAESNKNAETVEGMYLDLLDRLIQDQKKARDLISIIDELHTEISGAGVELIGQGIELCKHDLEANLDDNTDNESLLRFK